VALGLARVTVPELARVTGPGSARAQDWVKVLVKAQEKEKERAPERVPAHSAIRPPGRRKRNRFHFRCPHMRQRRC
jgi:hypothetical protein